MGIFDRLSTMLRSNINDLISRAENPEKMLNQLIIDMKSNLAKVKQEVAGAIADEKKLQADSESMRKQAEDWERRAMLAVQEGRDDLAKQALLRYNEHLQGAQVGRQRQRERIEAGLELAEIQALELQGVGQHDVIPLDAVGPVHQVGGVVFEQLPEQLGPAGLLGRQFHHADPEDQYRRCVAHHHLGFLRRAHLPEPVLELIDSGARRLHPVQEGLDVIPCDHGTPSARI